jgi:heme/copper-type cytochrome/quinol oxidase subunit 2
MKIGKYLSVISIIIALIVALFKLQFDIHSYETISEALSNADGDINPTVVAGGIKVLILYFIPVIISLILSFIGYKRKNKHYKLALGINVISILYLIIPVGIILGLTL